MELPPSRSRSTKAFKFTQATEYTENVRNYHTLFAALSKLNGVVFLVSLFLSNRDAKITCAAFSVCVVISHLFLVAFNSIEICVLLCQRYEYCFVTGLNFLNWTLTIIIFDDVRVCNCVAMWTATQLIIMMDTSFRSSLFAVEFTIAIIPSMLVTAA